MKVNPIKMKAVMALSGPERYSHFVKVAADQRKVWGLLTEGWAMASTDEGALVFPLWPAEVYAACCKLDDWSSFEPSEIDISRLLEQLFPDFSKKGIQVAVFPTPSNRGVIPDVIQLETDLKSELARIE